MYNQDENKKYKVSVSEKKYLPDNYARPFLI